MRMEKKTRGRGDAVRKLESSLRDAARWRKPLVEKAVPVESKLPNRFAESVPVRVASPKEKGRGTRR
ncbi:hypothetical protein A6S26_17840 [Nostoc sp. ATCC 43529]|nr:hypothetical protein A6S26_17840 [Nostoc sp. ATCC 43529]